MADLDTTVEELLRLDGSEIASAFNKDSSFRLNDFVPIVGFKAYLERTERYNQPPLRGRIFWDETTHDAIMRHSFLLFYNIAMFGTTCAAIKLMADYISR